MRTNPNRNRLRLPARAYEMVNGKAVMVFTEEEHAMLAETCRWTIIGIFLRGRPAVEKSRTDFARAISFKKEK